MIIRNETKDEIVLQISGGEVMLDPNKAVTISPDAFDDICLNECIVKIRKGVIKIKGVV
jgi:hypothetical protein